MTSHRSNSILKAFHTFWGIFDSCWGEDVPGAGGGTDDGSSRAVAAQDDLDLEEESVYTVVADKDGNVIDEGYRRRDFDSLGDDCSFGAAAEDDTEGNGSGAAGVSENGELLIAISALFAHVWVIFD